MQNLGEPIKLLRKQNKVSLIVSIRHLCSVQMVATRG
uniref:Uncharacterized protein n=1 Tax=Arundo donax TaxID=35708 RepID=A0A0A9ABB1_ARUDO